MSSLITQQIRSLNDMLSAERILRASSENTVRELRQLLLDTAIRLDGQRMEQARRTDPHAPGNWTVPQWQDFMEAIPAAGSWGVVESKPQSSQSDEQRIKYLLAELDRVASQFESTAKQVSALTKERDELQAMLYAAANAGSEGGAFFMPSKILEGSIAPWVFLLEESKKIVKLLPKPCPLLQKVFVGGGRVGGDLQKAFGRVYVTLYLIGKHRLCSTMEIDALIGGATETSARSGSLRRVMDEMIEKKILESTTLSMGSPKTSLKVVRLSEKGEQVYRELFKSDPQENDWARLIRLHEGDKNTEHTLAVLTFGVHARKYGYYTRVIPDVDGNAVPDIWIARSDEALHVEVELGNKDHVTKWKNLAALNEGRVAICTSVPRLRERYVGDCKLDESGVIKSGVATDIEMLVKNKYIEVANSTSLWIDAW
jgi:hypothetical protein